MSIPHPNERRFITTTTTYLFLFGCAILVATYVALLYVELPAAVLLAMKGGFPPGAAAPFRRLAEEAILYTVMEDGDDGALLRHMPDWFHALGHWLVVCEWNMAPDDSRLYQQLWPGSIVSVTTLNATHYTAALEACRVATMRQLILEPHLKWVIPMTPYYKLQPPRVIGYPVVGVNYVDRLQRVANVSTMSQYAAIIERSVFMGGFCAYFLDVLRCTDTSYAHFHGMRINDTAPRLVVPHASDGHAHAHYLRGRYAEERGRFGRAHAAYKRHNGEQTLTNYLYDGHYRLARTLLANHTCQPNAYDVILASFMGAFRQRDGYFRREPLYYAAWWARTHGRYHDCLLYGLAALHLPPLEWYRMPLHVEVYLYEEQNPIREEVEYCLAKMKE